MNTIQMFQAAKQASLSHERLMAHCLWALVSQAGRGFMTVGEVAKMVNLTSGYKPSTYQVNRMMDSFFMMNVATFADGPNRGKGKERVYAATDTSIGLLSALAFAFDNQVLNQAITDLTQETWSASRKTFEELKKYNKQLESENA